MRPVFTLTCILGLALFGCGETDPKTTPTPESTAGSASEQAAGTGAGFEASAGSSAPPTAGGDFEVLIDAEWDVPAQHEGYVCARRTLTEDIYISEFKALIPLGTHHTVLTIEDDPSEPDGVTDCGAGTNGFRQLYGSGVGTETPSALPPGVAVKVEAGQQLLLNLHLFNFAEEPLSGRSGTLVKYMREEDVDTLAEMTLAGPISLQIPPGRSTQTGRCTFSKDATLVTIAPHMHQLGRHMKVVAESSVEGPVVLFDGAYEFDEQLQYPIDPSVQLQAGDALRIECTYENDTERAVTFGDSSLDEMCFAGVFRYPVSGRRFLCTE